MFSAVRVETNLDDYSVISQECIQGAIRQIEKRQTSVQGGGTNPSSLIKLHRKKDDDGKRRFPDPSIRIQSSLLTNHRDRNDIQSPTRPENSQNIDHVAKVTMSDCLACSGCATTSEVIFKQHHSIDQFIEKKDKKLLRVISISPQSRITLATYFGTTEADVMRRLSGFFHSIGFDYCIDMSLSESLAIIESQNEFLETHQNSNRLQNPSQYDYDPSSSITSNERKLPLLCSHCPALVLYTQKNCGEKVVKHLSRVRSSQQIQGIIVKHIMRDVENHVRSQKFSFSNKTPLDIPQKKYIKDIFKNSPLLNFRHKIGAQIKDSSVKSNTLAHQPLPNDDENQNMSSASTSEIISHGNSLASQSPLSFHSPISSPSPISPTSPVLSPISYQLHDQLDLNLSKDSHPEVYLPTSNNQKMDYINNLSEFGDKYHTNIHSSYYQDTLGYLNPDDIFHVCVMPCSDKKVEAARPEINLQSNSSPDIDIVLNTSEILDLFKRYQVQFRDLPQRNIDQLINEHSNRFFTKGKNLSHDNTLIKILSNDMPIRVSEYHSSSGGYTDRLFRFAAKKLYDVDIQGELEFVPNHDPNVKEVQLIIEDKVVLRFGLVYGFKNITNVIKSISSTRSDQLHEGNHRTNFAEFDYIELMACPRGCLNGGGQSALHTEIVNRDYPSLPGSLIPGNITSATIRREKNYINELEKVLHSNNNSVFVKPEEFPHIDLIYDYFDEKFSNTPTKNTQNNKRDTSNKNSTSISSSPLYIDYHSFKESILSNDPNNTQYATLQW